MVAFPAGGSTDIAARIVASIAEKALGQPIVVVNRGGAGGQIGWTDWRASGPTATTSASSTCPPSTRSS